VILVARAGRTPKAAVRRAAEVLLQVNASIMGIVLNAFNIRSADGDYYYYGYGNEYSSAYHQSEEKNQNARAS